MKLERASVLDDLRGLPLWIRRCLMIVSAPLVVYVLVFGALAVFGLWRNSFLNLGQVGLFWSIGVGLAVVTMFTVRVRKWIEVSLSIVTLFLGIFLVLLKAPLNDYPAAFVAMFLPGAYVALLFLVIRKFEGALVGGRS